MNREAAVRTARQQPHPSTTQGGGSTQHPPRRLPVGSVLAALLAASALSHPAAAQDLARGGSTGAPQASQAATPPAFAPGRLLVAPKAGVSEARFAAALAAHGSRSMGRLRGMRTHMVQVPPGQSEEKLAERLGRHPHVEFAELDRVALPGATTNDPMLSSQWHLPKINAPTAWNTSAGAGTIVAILDTGIDPAHPDLAGQLVPGWNFHGNNGDTSDPNGHGTAVAGAAAAAANNGTGVASVAWGAKLMPVRIADANAYAYWSTVAQGLTWAADNGARIANISYVGVAASATVQSAANYLRGKGGLVVVCAGNNGKDENIAASDSMLVVSATNSGDARTSWSSYGSFVDLAAPGDTIYTTHVGGGYRAWSGTSLASPVVAGAAAMLKAMRPDFTPSQIEAALYAGAVDLGSAGKDSIYGHGRVDAAAALAAAGTANVDTVPPTAAITSPTGGSASGTVSVQVDARDDTGVARVELLANGRPIGSDDSAPYSFAWDTTGVADGSVTLSAVAYDERGNTGLSSPVTVKVSNAAATLVATDATPPSVAILSPSSGLQVNGAVTITASARDDGGLAWVQIAIDGTVVASTTKESLSYKWNTRKERAGAHTITLSASDKAGNVATTSVTVSK